MRIWDVSPGYLNRQSLLGEHRELHGLLSILVHRKKGYSRHPETMRWAACMSGLARRHDVLVAEMRLRGYTDRTHGRLVNALEHMWGHVADATTAADSRRARALPWELLRTTREVAVRIREPTSSPPRRWRSWRCSWNRLTDDLERADRPRLARSNQRRSSVALPDPDGDSQRC